MQTALDAATPESVLVVRVGLPCLASQLVAVTLREGDGNPSSRRKQPQENVPFKRLLLRFTQMVPQAHSHFHIA